MHRELYIEIQAQQLTDEVSSATDLITFTLCPAHQVLPPTESIKTSKEMNTREGFAPKLRVVPNILYIKPQGEGQGLSAAILLHYFHVHIILSPELSQADRLQTTTKPSQ